MLTESVVLALAGATAGVLVGKLMLLGRPGPAAAAARAPGPSVRIDGRVLAFTAAMASLAGIIAGPRARAPGHASRCGRRAERRGLRTARRTLALVARRQPGRRADGSHACPAGRRGTADTQHHAGAAREAGLRSGWTGRRRRRIQPDRLHGRTGNAGIRTGARSGPIDPGRPVRLAHAATAAGDQPDTQLDLLSRPPACRRRSGHHQRHDLVDQDYFATLGVPLLQGRNFTAADTPASARVAIVNAAFARTYFSGGHAVGRRFRLRGIDGPEFEIVGVVADYKVQTVGEPPTPVHPLLDLAARVHRPGRARADLGRPNALIAAIRREFLSIEPNTVFSRQPDDGDAGRHDAAAGAAGRPGDRHRGTRCHAAGRDRPLRGDRLCRGAPHARDRHPHGPRCASVRRPRDGHASGAGRDGRGPGRRLATRLDGGRASRLASTAWARPTPPRGLAPWACCWGPPSWRITSPHAERRTSIRRRR